MPRVTQEPLARIVVDMDSQNRAANAVIDPDQKKAARDAYNRAMGGLLREAQSRSRRNKEEPASLDRRRLRPSMSRLAAGWAYAGVPRQAGPLRRSRLGDEVIHYSPTHTFGGKDRLQTLTAIGVPTTLVEAAMVQDNFGIDRIASINS